MIEEIALYVSTDGDDAWSGHVPVPSPTGEDGPFRSLERARDEIRSLSAADGLKRPVTVYIRGGTYYLHDTFVLGERDSGSAAAPITYAAFEGEQPLISGGVEITSRWEPHKGQILVADVDSSKPFRVLSANGKRQTRARAPNRGFFEIEEALSDISFRYRDGEIEKRHDWEDMEVVLFHSWNETRFRVSNIDPKTRVIEFIDPHAGHGIGWSGAGGPNRYYVENVLYALDEPGEWYLDRGVGKLYFWPEEDIATTWVVVSVLDQLLYAENIEYVVFRGLTFSDTNWDLPQNGYADCGDVGDIVEPAAVTLKKVKHCRFENNCIKNTGTYGLDIEGSGNAISENRIFDTGGGGIITRSFETRPNEISYNRIHHCGAVYPSSVGINIDDGGGLVRNNLIHDITQSGIYTRHWATETQPRERRNQEQGLVIERNEIFDVMTVINDGGGIFVRDSNIVIRNNLIHDVLATGSRCPGRGIYLGCETRDTLVENNIVYRCLVNLIVWYNNRNISIRNNIFVDSREAQVRFSNPAHLGHENIKLERNVIYCTYTRSDLFGIHGERSLPSDSDDNIVFSALGCVLYDPVIKGIPGIDSFTTWRDRGFDKNTITADPRFTDFDRDDYSLKTKSPAFRVGFKPIDISDVGLRGGRR